MVRYGSEVNRPLLASSALMIVLEPNAFVWGTICTAMTTDERCRNTLQFFGEQEVFHHLLLNHFVLIFRDGKIFRNSGLTLT